jgi:CheY-like chemotaxis protein
MSNNSKYEVLLVDDQFVVRDVLAAVLRSKGYRIRTADNGFDALLELKVTPLPDVLIADLNMPQMSGFELLSVVRRRFPKIPVIAMSGAYAAGGAVPGNVIADHYYSKASEVSLLLTAVDYLIETTLEHAVEHVRESAPVWVPRNGVDLAGTPYVVVTCTECLRSFPQHVKEHTPGIQTVECMFCRNQVRYIIDFSVAVTASRFNKVVELHTNVVELHHKEKTP